VKHRNADLWIEHVTLSHFVLRLTIVSRLNNFSLWDCASENFLASVIATLREDRAAEKSLFMFP